jgi:hypothetical protein
MSAGMACLAIGLSLQLFVHPEAGVKLNVVHAVFGFLIGISVVLNLKAVILTRRQQRGG